MNFPPILYTRTFWTALGAAVASSLAVFEVGTPYSTAVAVILAYLSALFLEVGVGKIGNDQSYSVLPRPTFWAANAALSSGLIMAFGFSTKAVEALAAIYTLFAVIFVRNTALQSQAAIATKNGEELRLSLKPRKNR
jgi:uncharacterized membrane protein YphA (DoxX/SURF4 family)